MTVLAKSSLKKLPAGYETPIYIREDGGEINTGIKFKEHIFSGNITAKKKKILSSAVVKFFNRIAKMISFTSTRGFGGLFLSHGLLTLIYEIADVYFDGFKSSAVFPLVFGALLTILAIPGKPLVKSWLVRSQLCGRKTTAVLTSSRKRHFMN